MVCPKCGNTCESNHRFCSVCGSELFMPEKGSHLPPILIMAGLSVIGIVLFFLFPV